MKNTNRNMTEFTVYIDNEKQPAPLYVGSRTLRGLYESKRDETRMKYHERICEAAVEKFELPERWHGSLINYQKNILSLHTREGLSHLREVSF